MTARIRLASAALAVFLSLPRVPSAAEKPEARWLPVSPAGLKDVQAMAVLDGFLFIAGDSGVFRTGDFGRTWKRVHPKATLGLGVQGIRLFAGGRKTLYRSADYGATWREITGNLPPMDSLAMEDREFQTFATEGRHLFAGTFDDGVFRSGDFGETWMQVDEGLDNPIVLSLVATGKRILAGTTSQMYASTDLGKRWVRVDSPKVAIRGFAHHGGRIYAASFENGMYCSADGGKTWKDADHGTRFAYLYDLLEARGTLYAGSSDGVYGLSDPEAGWSPVGSGIPEDGAYELAALGDYLFMSSYGGLIYCLGPSCPAP